MNPRLFIQAQLVETDRLLGMVGDHPLMAPNLQSRKVELVRQLDELPPDPTEAKATLYFTGPPVSGSSGIDVDFTADVLKPFSRMVKAGFAESRNFAEARRPRRDPFDSRLMLTALPRGSFGLELTPSGQSRPEDAQAMSVVLSQMSGLISASAESDNAFADRSADVPSRLLVALRDLLKAINARKADLRLVTGDREVRLARDVVNVAYERVRSTVSDERTERINGVSRGIALDSSRFDFRTDDGDVISGYLADEVDEDQADRMATMATRECVAVLRVISVTSRNGTRRTKYELLDLVARH